MAGQPIAAWAQRIRRERTLRGWSQADAVRALLAHGDSSLPDREHILRRWKSWEAGESTPSGRYQGLIAKTFGTTRYAIFPAPQRSDEIAGTGMDTLEILTRLQRSDVDGATLDALRITVDRLCSEYAYVPADQLLVEGRDWLTRVADLRQRRLTLTQHQEVLVLAGWLALLVGCVEYDLGQAHAAESTRRAALSLGTEAGHGEIQGWAHEMRAWFALTSGDYRGVVEAARAGRAVAGAFSVNAQLAAQEAKAWARMGDRRQVEVALDRGRDALDALPYPDNVAHHFVVDPAKFDFYAMDVYRIVGVDSVAESLAQEILKSGFAHRAPMRVAEARITLGVVAARTGELEQAVDEGRRAISDGPRRSLPSLHMAADELAVELRTRYPDESSAREYVERVQDLGSTTTEPS
ncbi:XRE family transcriptional regulator [Jiangella mangrovi]|uniref:Transcriptional regulator with XRE-family HTH domain n=1 Tax=Jiangella mangrovi TaxID=1524084 RepID=A0A7W9GTR0_9ACTN|nr:XRE family transcriptional regulator [Jiangella mangrovi]MBB5789875.1 transcriptional regulator with XRE-family HTH domain [Jiangella mangrovi]